MDFTTTNRTPRGPEAVFALILDLSKWPLFTGFGPLPGIAEATCADSPLREGSRIRVRNTDGSVHHEVIDHIEPNRRYAIHMELDGSAAYVLREIREHVELTPDGEGTVLSRRFEVSARSFLTWPLAWLVARVLLPRAVRRHDAAVGDALGATGSRT